MEASIRTALAARRLVKFKYHGHTRVVEPHALGRVTGDRLALLGWQVSGGSGSGPTPDWRTFVLAEMSSLKIQPGRFTPRPEYDAATSQLKEIEAEVSSRSRGK